MPGLGAAGAAPGLGDAARVAAAAAAAPRAAAALPQGLFCAGSGNVVVCGRADVERVYKSGCFGSSASTGSLKPLFLRHNRRRFRDLDADANWVEPWRLSLVEAFYMVSHGQLAVREAGGAAMDAAACWRAFSTQSTSFSSARRFACLCAVYESLKRQGWVVKMGQTYGGHFVVYQGDPDFFHSQFCVLVRDAGDAEPWDWIDATREMRVANQTSKEVMLCEVQLEEPADAPSPKCTLDFVILLRWVLKHEEVGKERAPHNKLKRKLIDPNQKGPKRGGHRGGRGGSR
jgi:tRNA-intron lyase